MQQSESYSLQSFISFVSNNFVIILFSGLFFIGGFFVGSLWTENQLLAQDSNLGAANPTANAPLLDAGNAPSGPTEEQFDKLPPVDDSDYKKGAANPKITLVEYSDFECPFCKNFHITMQEIVDEYKGEVAWVYRHYPLSFHVNAQKAAEAAECVGEVAGSDAFWKFGDLYFERTSSSGTGIALSDLASLGAEAGANQAAVQKCLDSDQMAQKVKDQFTLGGAAGVSGTPGTFIVTDEGVQELIPGALPYDQVKQSIEKYL